MSRTRVYRGVWQVGCPRCQRLVEAGGMYGDGIVVASVTAPLAAGYAGACGAREYSGAHYSRRADGRIEFAVWG